MCNIDNFMKKCELCPRNCGVDRTQNKYGYCRAGVLPKLALASVHHWEEPSISGIKGSGTIFFSHCNLKCVFCQNYMISNEDFGKEITVEQLSDLFLKQQNKLVHNINIVSATHFIPQLKAAIILAKSKGLVLPIIYNTNGYETVDSLRILEGLIDVYLPDIKYFDNQYSEQFSYAPNYFDITSKAVLEMVRQTGSTAFDKEGMIQKGVIIRHLVLPGCKEDSKKILNWIKTNLGDDVYVSLMNQYTPMYKAMDYKQIARKLTTFEYQRVVNYFLEIGLQNGYIQKKSSATADYTPNFDLSGL